MLYHAPYGTYVAIVSYLILYVYNKGKYSTYSEYMKKMATVILSDVIQT